MVLRRINRPLPTYIRRCSFDHDPVQWRGDELSPCWVCGRPGRTGDPGILIEPSKQCFPTPDVLVFSAAS